MITALLPAPSGSTVAVRVSVPPPVRVPPCLMVSVAFCGIVRLSPASMVRSSSRVTSPYTWPLSPWKMTPLQSAVSSESPILPAKITAWTYRAKARRPGAAGAGTP